MPNQQWTPTASQDQRTWNQSTTPQADPTQTQGRPTTQNNQQCEYCSDFHDKGYRNCKAYGTICTWCSLPNHNMLSCHRRQRQQPVTSDRLT
jgi:hypothetical protein